MNVTAEIDEMEHMSDEYNDYHTHGHGHGQDQHPYQQPTDDSHETKYLHIIFAGVTLLVFVCITSFILTIILGLKKRKLKTRVCPLYVLGDEGHTTTTMNGNGGGDGIRDVHDVESTVHSSSGT